MNRRREPFKRGWTAVAAIATLAAGGAALAMSGPEARAIMVTFMRA